MSDTVPITPDEKRVIQATMRLTIATDVEHKSLVHERGDGLNMCRLADALEAQADALEARQVDTRGLTEDVWKDLAVALFSLPYSGDDAIKHGQFTSHDHRAPGQRKIHWDRIAKFVQSFRFTLSEHAKDDQRKQDELSKHQRVVDGFRALKELTDD